MRSIKFRAWYRPKAKMLYGVELGVDVGITVHFGGLLYSEHFEVMQFTGYRDKYKKDIYEGDIIQSSNRYELYLVVWEGSGWKCRSIKHSSRTHGLAGHVELRAVIANMYENPKLLKTK